MSQPEEDLGPGRLEPPPPVDPPIVDLRALAFVIGLLLLAVVMMLAMVHR